MSASSAVAVIEALLYEFYNPSTPAGRKRQVENDLLAYKHSPESWQVCLRTAISSKEPQTSEFYFFFAVSTLEHAITRRWAHLTLADRSLLRETLWNAFVHLPMSSSSSSCTTSACAVVRRQKDCYAQLIALLGKREFPDEHPDYMLHCLALLKTKLPLGISLLRVTSEEVVSNRENVTTERKSYFHACITLCMPEVMDLITKYLMIAVCYVNQRDVHTLTSSTVMDYTLLAALPLNDNIDAADDQQHWQKTVVDLLNCLQHLISWISTEYLSEYLLMSVLDLSQYRSQYKDITLSAVSVLNELLYLQKPLSSDAVLVAGICGLLEQHNIVKSMDEMYMDKFRELLRLCTAKYWSKIVNESELLDRFLKSLYSLTTLKNGALDFTEKLEIWMPLIKGLSSCGKVNRYSDMLYQLVAETMRRTQFCTNKAELELLDNETIEDNTQTEWQQFLTQCIECVAIIAEARPNAVFAQVFAHWSRPHVYLMSVQNDLENGGVKNSSNNKLKVPQLGEHLRDCSTICQAVVRLAPLLDPTTECNSEVQRYLQMLIDTLLAMLGFCCAVSPKLLSSYDMELCAFQGDLAYLHAHVLMALRSVLAIKSSQLRSDEIINRLFAPLTNVFEAGQAITLAPIIYLAASELLLCVSAELRPKCLLDVPMMQGLLQIGSLPHHLPHNVAANVYISVIAYFVLPWKNIAENEQNFAGRCIMLREYIDNVARYFLETDLSTVTMVEAKISMVSVNFLTTFSLVLEYFRDCNNTTKEMLVNVFKPIITKALIIYNTFCNSTSNIVITTTTNNQSNNGGATNICVAVAEFTLCALRTLQTQLGIQFIRELITLFITANNRECVASSRLAVLERVLQMFQLIVQQPGNGSLSLVPAILDFVITQVLPLLHENSNTDNTDVAVVVYSLFDNILTCKWQYFYKAHFSAQQLWQQQQPNIADNLHPEHFMAILNAYGQALVNGVDPNHVRIVLSSMQSVNERWRLYQRPMFRDNLLTSFQKALIHALIGGSAEGALHRELLTNALFAMGQIDTLKMRELFAEAGFAAYSKAIDDICLATDIPTFSQKLDQLIQDAHCLQLNQSR